MIGRHPNRSMAALPWLRRWADLLDSRFRIPGTRIRFGIDPVFSLIPGVGELASPVFTVVLIVQGLRQRVPKVVMVRMVVNALIDACIGAVPIAGNIGDIFWRANAANLQLLERHAHPGRAPARSDVVFTVSILVGLAVVVSVPIVVGIFLTTTLWHWLLTP